MADGASPRGRRIPVGRLEGTGAVAVTVDGAGSGGAVIGGGPFGQSGGAEVVCGIEIHVADLVDVGAADGAGGQRRAAGRGAHVADVTVVGGDVLLVAVGVEAAHRRRGVAVAGVAGADAAKAVLPGGDSGGIVGAAGVAGAGAAIGMAVDIGADAAVRTDRGGRVVGRRQIAAAVGQTGGRRNEDVLKGAGVVIVVGVADAAGERIVARAVGVRLVGSRPLIFVIGIR